MHFSLFLAFETVINLKRETRNGNIRINNFKERQETHTLYV